MIHFDSVEQAKAYAEELESEKRSVTSMLEEKWFDDAYTERAMIAHIKDIDEQLDELWPLILGVEFPLL
jgi:viroplasmin and RNaseH domain-containing protein